MGGVDKLLEDAAGHPLLRRAALAAIRSNAAQVHVIVPGGDVARRAALAGLDIGLHENTDAAEGMGSSIRCGVSALPATAGAVLIALADMPDIRAGDHNALIRRWGETGRICRAATIRGAPGHPVLFPRQCLDDLMRLGGGDGARELLRRAGSGVELVRLPGCAARTDLDTPDDWRRWRAENSF